MKCSKCKWWVDDPSDRFQHPLDPTTYEPLPPSALPFEVRECRSPRLATFQRPQAADCAALMDGSEYWAVLYSGPDFGCTNFEEKK